MPKPERTPKPDEPIVIQQGGQVVSLSAQKQGQLTPKFEMAIKMYAATGKSIKDIAKAHSVDYYKLATLINSPQGEMAMNEVRSGLDRRFESLFEKVINTLEEGLVHAEPAVALAASKLWLTHAKGTKVEVALTAEDVIQKLMSGSQEVAIP